MKKNIILSIFVLSAIYAGSVFIGHVSAQKEVSGDHETRSPAYVESTAPQTLPFMQNWTNVGLITTNNDWSGVPGIVGYRGDELVTATGVDPRTILVDGSATPISVTANQTAPDTFTSGAVAEFEITNPTIALNGSGTADAPHIVVYLNTTGFSNIQFACNIRDIDGSADNAIQQVDVQYRVGGTGNYASVSGGYIADATTAGTATQVTPLNLTLPAAANNQALVEVRVLTTNAVGNDEVTGIDDINVTGTGGGAPSPVRLFTAHLNGANEVGPNASTGRGYGRVVLNDAETMISASVYWNGLSSGTISGHIHGPAPVGTNAGIIFDLMPTTGVTSGSRVNQQFAVTPAQVADLKAGLWYFNVHTTNFPSGEIRGQIIGGQANTPFDYDADNRADIGVFRPADPQGSTFYVLKSGTDQPVATRWGVATDKIAAGDFDGDGKADIGVWRPTGTGDPNRSFYFILNSATSTVRTDQFGRNGDIPVVGDWDGDGRDDLGVYRNGASPGDQSFFFHRPSGSPTVDFNTHWWGSNADIPVVGDWDGDGRMDPAVFRPSDAVWYILPSTTNTLRPERWGVATDTLVPKDYDGDGLVDLATFRNGVWSILQSSSGLARYVHWGQSGDKPVPADYDGDGRSDVAVFRPSDAVWYIQNSSNGQNISKPFGISTDRPAQCITDTSAFATCP